MKLFFYKGYYLNGKKEKGLIVAKDVESAKRILKRKGIIPSKIKEKNLLFVRFLPISYEEWAFLFSTYARYLKAGVSIQQATANIIEEQFNPKLSFVLYEVSNYLSEGLSFSEALKRTGKLPASITEAVKIGEETGRLPEVLNHLHTRFKEKASIKKKLLEAVVTPTIIFLMLLGFMIYAPYLIKQFEGLYARFPKAEFPLYSKIMINVLSAFSYAFPFIAVGLVVGMFFFLKTYRSSHSFKRFVDGIILKIPVVGKTVLSASIYDAFLEIKILYSAGIPLQRGVEMVANATHNEILKEGWKDVMETIGRGEPFFQALRRNPYVPPLVKSLVVFGVETGALESELEEIVDYLREKLNAQVQFIKSTVEPFLLFVSGILVTAVLLAIYLPMFNIGKLLQNM